MATVKTPHSPAEFRPRHRAVADDPGRADPGRSYALAACRFGKVRLSVACIEYDLTDEQALLFMLDQLSLRRRSVERLLPNCDGAATGTALAVPGRANASVREAPGSFRQH